MGQQLPHSQPLESSPRTILGQPKWAFLTEQHQGSPIPGLSSHKGAFPWLWRHQRLLCSFGQHSHGVLQGSWQLVPWRDQGPAQSLFISGWSKPKNLSHPNTVLHSLKCHTNYSIITNPEEPETTWIQYQQIQNRPCSKFHFHFEG